MKKLTILAALLVASVAAFAQGTINFSNGAAGVNAPVLDTDNLTKLAGTGFIAQLYAGSAGTLEGSLVAVTPTATFATGASAGYFFGGQHTIPTVGTGSAASVQVRVWNAAFATWDAAFAAYTAGDATAKIGKSNVFNSPALGGGALPAPNMVGLTGFQLTTSAVPEPSVLALGALGAAALLIRRRRNK